MDLQILAEVLDYMALVRNCDRVQFFQCLAQVCVEMHRVC